MGGSSLPGGRQPGCDAFFPGYQSRFGDGHPSRRQCTAIARGTGQRCRCDALQGATRCRSHGGHMAAYATARREMGEQRVISFAPARSVHVRCSPLWPPPSPSRTIQISTVPSRQSNAAGSSWPHLIGNCSVTSNEQRRSVVHHARRPLNIVNPSCNGRRSQGLVSRGASAVAVASIAVVDFLSRNP